MSPRTRNRLVGATAVLALVGAGVVWWLSRPGPLGAAPERYALEREPSPPRTSTLTLPVRISLADLEDRVEEQIPETVLDLREEPLGEAWAVDLVVTRPGAVTARGRDGRMVLEVPLSVNARTWRQKRAERRAEKGKGAPGGIGVDFQAVLELELDLALGTDWTLNSQTELGVRWIDPPTLDLGPISIPIRKPIEKALTKQLDQVAAQIDANLAESDGTRDAVERAWTELFEPRQLQSEPPVWLIGTPEALYASDLQVTDEGVELWVGYRGTWQTVLGDPGPTAQPRPLPPRAEPPDAPGFHLDVPAALQWDTLSALATEALSGQEWTLPGTSKETAVLRVSEIELYPSGERIAVAVDYTAVHPGWDTDGTLYLTGIPSVDADARSLSILEFEYVLDTWDTSIASANVLVQSGLESAVAERLVFPYGEALDRAIGQTNDALSLGRETEDGGTISGSLDAIEVRGVTLTDEALVIEASASGSLSLQAAPQDRGLERPRRR